MKNVKKFIALFLAVLSLIGCLTINASALSDSVDDILFDADYYASLYPDLAAAGIRSASALRQHWDRYGCREGRRPSIFYDPNFYLSKYDDIRQVFGTDYLGIYNHFKNWGIRENRTGSSEFCLVVYKENYADLRQAFGDDNIKYYVHYRDWGRAERRNATTSLSASVPVSETPAFINTTSLRLNIRQKPSTNSAIIAKLDRGTKVTLLEISNGWAKIRLDNGRIGYASAQYISVTAPQQSSSSGTLHSPVPSGCTFNRKTSDGQWYGYHDINRGVARGTPVYAIADGTVTFHQASTNGYLTSYGNYIKFTSSDGRMTAIYAHLNGFQDVPTVISSSMTSQKSGSTRTYNLGSRNVKAGDILGYIGSTGNSSGTHLHLELRMQGTRVDPTTVFPELLPR